jgi:hypothetical protein
MAKNKFEYYLCEKSDIIDDLIDIEEEYEGVTTE